MGINAKSANLIKVITFHRIVELWWCIDTAMIDKRKLRKSSDDKKILINESKTDVKNEWQKKIN